MVTLNSPYFVIKIGEGILLSNNSFLIVGIYHSSNLETIVLTI